MSQLSYKHPFAVELKPLNEHCDGAHVVQYGLGKQYHIYTHVI